MEMDIYYVDAFTDQQFKGNSAAVVPVSDWPAVELMQNIAIENNLSETAFIKPLEDNRYAIRWFSPITEIDFCGHATLASSYVLFHHLGVTETIEFVTSKVGTLVVRLNDAQQIEMSFPVQNPEPVADVPQALFDGLSCRPISVLKNRQAYVVVLANERDVREVQYDSALLKTLAPYDVVVTAAGDDYDFVSRYFWPANGGDEDPVTGSIHAGLTPYWAKQLNKSVFRAYQASRRGGVLHCKLCDDRVVVSGNGVLYMKGRLFVAG